MSPPNNSSWRTLAASAPHPSIEGVDRVKAGNDHKNKRLLSSDISSGSKTHVMSLSSGYSWHTSRHTFPHKTDTPLDELVQGSTPNGIEVELDKARLLLCDIEQQLKAQIVSKDIVNTFTYEANEIVQSCKGVLQECQDTKKDHDDKQLRQDSVYTKKHSSSELVVVLSDVFEALRELAHKEKESTKGEAPLLVYGYSGRLSASLNDASKANSNIHQDVKYASTISSVYFDSPKLDLYRDRIARREGAQLLRARWYGQRPKGNEPVFLELKTHHESWVDTKSIKERATILENDMASFLYPSKAWDAKDAEAVILRATPKLLGEKLSKAIDLLLRMHSLVFRLGLRPCVRSTYKRLAFQSSTSNALRLTLDRQVLVSDESCAKSGQWCLDDDLIYTRGRGKVIPFSVVEIKLGDNQSSAVWDTLIENGVIIDSAKFSKFITGAATFHQHHVSTLPYWASHPAFADMLLHEEPLDTKSNDSSLPSETQDDQKYNKSKGEEVSHPTEIPPKFPQSSFFRRRNNRSRTSGTDKWIAPKKAVRVEPKSYFANERTFVQWISAALFLVTISALLLEFESQQGYALYTSKGMSLFSLLIALYALYLYYHRAKLMREGRPYGYYDNFRQGTWREGCNRFEKKFPRRDPRITNQCLRHSLGNFSPLMFEPSDIAVDSERNLLLVPSMSDIIAFHALTWTENGLEKSTSSPFLVGVIPDADFEAVTIYENDVYVVSELGRNGGSTLFKFKWETDFQAGSNQMLANTGAWSLGISQVEGIAFSQASNKQPPEFYISGDVLQVELYDVPVSDNTASSTGNVEQLRHKHELNDRLIGQGLLDGNIGAMTFFEGVLYILHDNDRVVRSWNVTTGPMISSFALPFVADGNEQQWERLAFQRVSKTPNTASTQTSYSLRGTGSSEPLSDSVLLLHLTLDTLAAVWTLVVQEGEIPGTIFLPGCAVSP